MSALLIQEEFVAYLPSLARVVGGIPEAVTLQAIWFKADKATGELVMSRADLAEYLGTSPSSLGRYVKGLAALGVLTYEGRTREGYDKTTKFTVHPAALDALVRDAPTPVTAPVQDAPTALAESGGSEPAEVQDTPTRMGTPESVNLTHSQSVNLTHSSSKNEEVKTPSTPQPASDGFREFWAEFPASRWKGGRAAAQALWTSLPIEDRRDAWKALMAYKASEIWDEEGSAGSPRVWLENEPWLEYRAGNSPKPKPDTRIKWARPGEHRLED